MNNPKVCELLGVQLNEPFEIDGQHYSNPYKFIQENNCSKTICLVSRTGEEPKNWLLCGLINGEFKINKI